MTNQTEHKRRGAVVPLFAICLVALMGVTALAVDACYLMLVRTQLQLTATAAATAGVRDLPDTDLARTTAIEFAQLNMPTALHGTVLVTNDVIPGHWDFTDKTFTAGGAPLNALKAITRRAESNNNPAGLFFARIFGNQSQDIVTEAIATIGPASATVKTRFLIDSEMFDTDIPVIEDLAESLNMTPEQLLTDNDGDWFIDLPPGILELPTGQVGDEALFDIGHPAYPFHPDTDPSHADFLNYNEDSSSWRYDLVPKEMLDPLLGVSAVNDPSLYETYVDPDFVHVSPVFKSDISQLNPVDGAPAVEFGGPVDSVNALGWRRGLVAFKIIGVGADPDGPGGSVLPNLIIQIVDPATIDIDQVEPWDDEPNGEGVARLVW
ncbi:MAG: TadG family pilus assembly protein [Planctomycetaceae bacterium]